MDRLKLPPEYILVFKQDFPGLTCQDREVTLVKALVN